MQNETSNKAALAQSPIASASAPKYQVINDNMGLPTVKAIPGQRERPFSPAASGASGVAGSSADSASQRSAPFKVKVGQKGKDSICITAADDQEAISAYYSLWGLSAHGLATDTSTIVEDMQSMGYKSFAVSGSEA